MNPTISPEALSGFFAWAPFVLGVLIYAVAWMAKRHEGHGDATPVGQTFACATCGKRGARDNMVAQTHEGAVSYVCATCAGT